MKKDIQKQLHRMTFVVVVMIAFAIWQLDFVITAINSNILLNSTIIGTFIFGLVLSFRYLFSLYNEHTAFEALQEKYNDIQHMDKDESDPFWRYHRCQKPAIIFSPPQIMWQSYFLISDEISRTGSLKISAATMQTLIDGIDTRLEDQKSLTSYITGLLVFLGLIGTFVGLMVTLASVGQIIGDLDLSGKGDSTAVIQKLMENLKTPLQGMATGFSSSLFGLITSLALGLIGRFQHMAASSLRLSFEAWLSSLVRITDDHDGLDPVAGQGGTGIDAKHLRLMYNVAKYSITSSNRTNRILERLTETVEEFGAGQRQHGSFTRQLAVETEKNVRYQSLMAVHLGQTARALAGHDEVAMKLREIDVALNTRLDDLARSVDRSVGNVEELTEEVVRLGQLDEQSMDADFESVMGEIEAGRELVLNLEQQQATGTDTNSAAKASPSPQQVQPQASGHEAVREMRGKLNAALVRARKQTSEQAG